VGRQKGNAVFLGTCAGITGFADEGKGFWRRRTSLTGEQWRSSPWMAPCREAAVLFGAASTTAGCLWRMLPDGMKRLADAGGYNRLVAACRMLVEEDLGARDERLGASGWGLELGDVEGLRGLDLAIESMGPHGVKREKVKVKSGEQAFCEFGSFSLTGLDALFSQMDAALGDSVGKKAGKFAVARRVSPRQVLDEAKVLAGMGTMDGWRGVKSEQLEVKSGEESAVSREPIAVGPQRRVRVWVHAVRLLPLVWVEEMACFVPGDDVQPYSNGFVTDWIMGDAASGWKDCFRELRPSDSISYSIRGFDWHKAETPTCRDMVEEGVYVVFTAIEVSEKRGRHCSASASKGVRDGLRTSSPRHWVRLPWCCKMRVQDVVVVGEELGASMVDQEQVGGRSMPNSCVPPGSTTSRIIGDQCYSLAPDRLNCQRALGP
jgi:hypothetical protein